MHQLLQPHQIYLTDGGLETTMIYHKGIELNHFAAFELLLSEDGKKELTSYYASYIEIAKANDLPFIFETPTWRANADWGRLMGYNQEDLKRINTESIAFMRDIAMKFDVDNGLFSGQIGPRGDGYVLERRMSAEEAAEYHHTQVAVFSEAGADFVTILTMNYPEEAAGLALAAKSVNIPAVVSFTVETDGNLPSGDLLSEAIEYVDRLSGNYPSYYMINCAHPLHFSEKLKSQPAIADKIRGIRANASIKSHAELEISETLDIGDKVLLANGINSLKEMLPSMQVLGGCCGTDHTHIKEICAVFLAG